jgi:NADH dehydrogenase FAD-containing subunit
MSAPSIIIIGGGAAAISMAHTLKEKLGFRNFEACRVPSPSYPTPLTYLTYRSTRSEKALEALGESIPTQDGLFSRPYASC